MADAPPLVVDAHTHAFPPEWVADRVNHCQRDRWFGELYEAPTAKMIDAVELTSAMDGAGVSLAIVCGWPWLDSGLCREHNDYLAAASRASNGRLAWLGIVAPASSDAAAEAERCLALGASGIGEVNADAQGVDIAKAGILADVAAVLIAADRPLLLHASEPVGHNYPGKGTATPDRLLSFLASNPELRARVSSAARDSIVAQYSDELNASRWLQLLRDKSGQSPEPDTSQRALLRGIRSLEFLEKAVAQKNDARQTST